MALVSETIKSTIPDAVQEDVVLHNIRAENVVFCYRNNDPDSLEVAQFYADKRGLSPDHLIPLDCSSDNVIDHSEFVSTIQDPLRVAITILDARGSSSATISTRTIFGSAGEKTIWVIILGYNIPHGYWPDDDPYNPPKAIASRLHRLSFDESDDYPNFTYDRRGDFRYFTSNDAEGVYITSVIDGPSKQTAIRLIERSIDVDNQLFVAGRVYCDPYGLKISDDQLQYQEDIIDFIDNESSNLGLETLTTVDTLKITTEPTFTSFQGDSFYWGWYLPSYSQNLFFDQNERRVFLYNADNESATNIKNDFDVDGSDPWCNIAINIEPGYAACAGTISETAESNYLRPRPFFEALHRGTSLGEAFLFSSPVIDSRIFLIGDPLMTVLFPAELPPEQDSTNVLIDSDEVIRFTKESLEEGLAWGYRQSNLINNILNINVSSSNFSEELNLLYALNKWNNLRSQTTQDNLFSRICQSFLSYILSTTRLTFSAWLSTAGEKTTSILNSLLISLGSGSVSDDLVYPEGHWQYDFVYTHSRQTLEDIYFQIQMAADTEFTNIVTNISMFDELDGWKYEQNVNSFVQMPNGFPSNFSGRRVRYVSTEDNYLIRLNLYYIRWRALDIDGANITDWTTGTMIVKR